MTDLQKMLNIYFTHPTMWVMGIAAGGGVYLAATQWGPIVAPLLALGWITYVVEEYLVHRFIFHAPAPKSQWAFDLLYRLHYGHHDQIQNKHLLFTPIWFALPLTIVNLIVMSPILGLENTAIAVYGGGVPAYLWFEWVHLMSHFRATKHGPLARYVTRRHGKHHYIDYSNWYTVSPGGQLVDKAFGSDPAAYQVVSNVRTCGLDPADPRLDGSRLRFGCDTSLANATGVLQHAGASPSR